MNIKIEAKKRKIGKKSDLKNSRKKGLIPGIIYGAGKEGSKILIPNIEFKKKYRKTIGEVAFFEIKVGRKKYTTILKDKQIHPVSRDFVHLDFLEIVEGQKVTVDIPINFVGESLGKTEGGIVDINLRTIEVSCLPKDVPDKIDVDITNMKIGDTIFFGDLDTDKFETDVLDDVAVINILAPMSEEEFEEALEADIEEEELEEIEALEEELEEELLEEGEEAEEGEEGEEGEVTEESEESKKTETDDK